MKIDCVLAFVLSAAPCLASANSVTGSIDGHKFTLDVSCEFLSNGWIKVRSNEPGFSQKDTSGDGYFFEASGPGQPLATVFHVGERKYTFGFSAVDVSNSGFIASETVRRRDGTTYPAQVTASC